VTTVKIDILHKYVMKQENYDCLKTSYTRLGILWYR